MLSSNLYISLILFKEKEQKCILIEGYLYISNILLGLRGRLQNLNY